MNKRIWHWFLETSDRTRYWFFETFAVRYIDRTYLGHGDFTEECGWIWRGKFYPLDKKKEKA